MIITEHFNYLDLMTTIAIIFLMISTAIPAIIIENCDIDYMYLYVIFCIMVFITIFMCYLHACGRKI